LKITRRFLFGTGARTVIPLSTPSGRPGFPTTTEQGNRSMRMISEKVIALLLAVVLSGTAFQTFIV
jgi:hypothetical protein